MTAGGVDAASASAASSNASRFPSVIMDGPSLNRVANIAELVRGAGPRRSFARGAHWGRELVDGNWQRGDGHAKRTRDVAPPAAGLRHEVPRLARRYPKDRKFLRVRSFARAM